MNALSNSPAEFRSDESKSPRTKNGSAQAEFPAAGWRCRHVGFAAILCALGFFEPLAQAATIVHDFYLPMPEGQIKQTFDALETGVGATLDSVFSVVITGEGTVIYYDQWEDGYEVDLAHPAQSSTKIWGDGNNLNGIPPGYTNDPVSFPVGTVLALRLARYDNHNSGGPIADGSGRGGVQERSAQRRGRRPRPLYDNRDEQRAFDRDQRGRARHTTGRRDVHERVG
jgi:hypothetical protein